MFKLIIKNLWSRRGRNAWLLAELTIVTVLAWIILDPVIVQLYTLQRPAGYDIDRLVRVDVMEVSKASPQYLHDEDSSEHHAAAIERIISGIEALPEVESAVPVLRWATFESQGMAMSTVNKDDSVSVSTRSIRFAAGTPFFETMGLTAAGGTSLSTLSGASDVVISKSLAEALYPGENAAGHYLGDRASDFNPEHGQRIAGVVDDAIINSSDGRNMIIYESAPLVNLVHSRPEEMNIVIRLKPAVEPRRFLAALRPLMATTLKSGNIKIHNAAYYPDIRDEVRYGSGETDKMRVNTALAVFFLVNLCLGVIGTFYLQTRKRSRDAGVMRSFGATPGYILREMLGEGALLTVIAWLIGCIAYMQYAIKEGLTVMGGFNGALIADYMPCWTDNFAMHFAVVSIIIYAIMTTVVCVGIYIPGRRISRVSPVEALRDE